MSVPTNLIVHQGDESLATKYMPKSEAKKRSILTELVSAEGRDMKRVCDKRIRQDRNDWLQQPCGVLLNYNRHQPRCVQVPSRCSALQRSSK